MIGWKRRDRVVSACAFALVSGGLAAVPRPAHAQEAPAAAPCIVTEQTMRNLAYPEDRERYGANANNDLNRFTVECLKMTKLDAYNSLDLNGQIQAVSNASNAEIVPSYTRYVRTPIEDGRVRASYYRFRLGASVPLDKDGKNATFADLTQPNLNEVGLIAGVEYGRVRVRRAELFLRAKAALDAARLECVQNKLSLPAPVPVSARAPGVALLTCDGAEIGAWMEKNAQKYYTALIKPQWKPREDPTLYAGFEGRYARARRSFFPLSDPAQTGTVPVALLPAGFPDGAASLKRDLFALKLYGGTSFLLSRETPADQIGKEKEAALEAAVTYRRDLQFVAGTKDQAICPAAPAIIRCATVNTAAPYLLDGWVGTARAALRLPRMLFIADSGIELRVNYAFDIDQIGFELPFYAFVGSDGVTNAGISFNCTTDGRTDRGFRLSGACKGSVFLGRKFRLTGRP